MSTSSTRPLIGIDLGTTYSLAGLLQAGRPVLIPNALGEVLTPSAVGLDDDGQLLVGAAARARAASHPEQTVLAFKRDMGTARQYSLGDRLFRPVDLSAMVLKSLVQDAERALGSTIEEAVITVPAYFGDAQRQATKDAGAIAGLRVDRIINEPTAAALAYGLHNRDRETISVVVDLGGGTFDVTVLEIIEGVIEIRSSAGDVRLGGEDFTDRFARYIGESIERELALPLEGCTRSMGRVREAAERAKRRLTTADEVEICIPALRGADRRTRDVSLTIERASVDELFRELLDRMIGPIRSALRAAQLNASDISEVLLVGGATRMPCVVDLVARMFDRLPNTDLPPDEVVAHGASVQAALKAREESVTDLVVTDIAPFTLGIATAQRVGSKIVEGLFTPILERGTVIPASRSERFHTLVHNQRMFTVDVYQGEHSLCRDNTKLGSYSIQNLPFAPAGGVWIDVRFTYDLNGILEVEMTVMDTPRTEHFVIEERPGKLSADAIAEAREHMNRIKFHPRESLPNRTALARADALYVELTGAARAELGEALGVFHMILETQDAVQIERVRQQLNVLIDSLRR